MIATASSHSEVSKRPVHTSQPDKNEQHMEFQISLDNYIRYTIVFPIYGNTQTRAHVRYNICYYVVLLIYNRW